MSKPKEKWYVSKQPGYSIALPEGLKYNETIAGVTREASVIIFRARGGKMVKTTDPEIQKFLESSIAFKRGKIMRVPTPEEIAAAEKQHKQEAALAIYKNLVEKQVPMNFRSMSDANVRDVADEIGVETSADGKKLSKDAIVDGIEILVYGEVVTKPEKKQSTTSEV